MTIDPRLERAISHDEIGLATARVGGAVLRSAFQPIFEVRGDALHPVAAEGFVRPFRDGKALPPRSFLLGLDKMERRDAERICLALHARNIRQIDTPDLAHIVAVDDFALAEDGSVDEGLLDEFAQTAGHGSAGRLGAFAFSPHGARASCGAALRDRGLLVSMGGFSERTDVWSLFRGLQPEMVHFDGFWFRRIAANQPALRLLALLVRRLHDDGARVLVRGIETRMQLASAIAIGGDLFQGFLMGQPALAGSVPAIEPRQLEMDPELENRIVSLFAN